MTAGDVRCSLVFIVLCVLYGHGVCAARPACITSIYITTVKLGDAVADNLKSDDFCMRNATLCYPSVLRLDSSIRGSISAANQSVAACASTPPQCTVPFLETQAALLGTAPYVNATHAFCPNAPDALCQEALHNISLSLGMAATSLDRAKGAC
eukprot:TRINITY_DN47103_c0_g1_i1.p1 TRINITY_DN47103_c0_g1~~TRINITY_DN47103_c0_g1_i1.p1  ORF type:complete len:153 (+),score=2.07 TRINITY_DN47103_c0_g1_i1:34-492(+)